MNSSACAAVAGTAHFRKRRPWRSVPDVLCDSVGEQCDVLVARVRCGLEARKIGILEVDPVDANDAGVGIVKSQKKVKIVLLPAPEAPTRASVSPERLGTTRRRALCRYAARHRKMKHSRKHAPDRRLRQGRRISSGERI